MKSRSLSRRARALIWFLGALVLFQSAGTLAILSFQRHLAEEDLAAHMDREVRLLGDVVEASLNSRDTAAAQRYLDIFCRDRQEIALARMIASNGDVLAHFERPADAARLLRASRTVDYGAGKHAVVELAYDLRDARTVRKRLAAAIVLASALVAALMGTLLWRVLRATAFRPLEQTVEELDKTREHLELRVAERTSDWMISNKELKEEIAERLASEQQLIIKDRAIASSINSIALAGFDGNLTYVNGAFLGLWRYTRPEEVLGRNATEFWRVPDAAAAIMQSVLATGACVGELTARRADGTYFTAQLSAEVVRDNAGAPICMMASFVDVTDRKRMEQDLRIALETQSVINALLRIPAEEAPLAGVMQQALERILKCPLYAFHPVGGIFLADEGTKRLALVAQQGFEEPLREACRDVSPGTCLCGQAAETGQIQFASDLDGRHTLPQPGVKPHGHYCVPIMQGAKTIGVLALYLGQGHERDEREEEFLRSVASALTVIIHRKRMEGEREALIVSLRRLLDAVSLSQQEWRETFDSITDPILLVNADRMVRRANRAFGALFGLRPQNVINRDCLDLLYRGQTPPEDDPILRGLREVGPVEGEIADPERSRVYRASVFPFTTSEKDLPGAIVVLKDITDEREREMLLIMSERLASLGRMASGIAHEINNPLAAIAGCVDGMSRRLHREQFDAPLFLKYLRIIKDEITRTKNITTNMLSFVRKSSYEQKQIDLHATIDSTLELIGYQGRLRNVEVRRHCLAAPPDVACREGEIRQVLLILITNALDAMQDEGVLTIATGVEGSAVTVDIGDNGPGIPAELLQHIFDPFFTTKTEQKGTGLGLSIAQRIVAGHNGSLRVLSHGAEGTTFRFTLPR